MNNKFNHQKGAVLIAGLMILLILTIMGIATMHSSALAEKMTGNFRDELIAFQAAESGLTDAENWLQTQAIRPEAVAACLTPPCELWGYGVQQDLEENSSNWWQTNARSFSASLYNTASAPRYVISEEMFVPYELSPEAIAKGKGYQFYRITTRGTGSTNQSQVFIESVFAVTFN